MKKKNIISLNNYLTIISLIYLTPDIAFRKRQKKLYLRKP